MSHDLTTCRSERRHCRANRASRQRRPRSVPLSLLLSRLLPLSLPTLHRRSLQSLQSHQRTQRQLAPAAGALLQRPRLRRRPVLSPQRGSQQQVRVGVGASGPRHQRHMHPSRQSPPSWCRLSQLGCCRLAAWQAHWPPSSPQPRSRWRQPCRFQRAPRSRTSHPRRSPRTPQHLVLGPRAACPPRRQHRPLPSAPAGARRPARCRRRQMQQHRPQGLGKQARAGVQQPHPRQRPLWVRQQPQRRRPWLPQRWRQLTRQGRQPRQHQPHLQQAQSARGAVRGQHRKRSLTL